MLAHAFGGVVPLAKMTLTLILLFRMGFACASSTAAADIETIRVKPNWPAALSPTTREKTAIVRSLPEAVSQLRTDMVRNVSFDEGQISDEDMAKLERFASLQYLDLHETQLKDETWKRLVALKRLTRMGFYNCEFSLAAAKAIRAHASIDTVTLDLCTLADGVASELIASQSVRFLRINSSPIEANWLRDKSWEPKIKELHLLHCELCDAHIESAGRLRSLETLSLDSSCFTDAGLKPIGELKNLRSLSVVRVAQRIDKTMACENICGIGDPVCETIATLQNLEELHLTGANITAQGIKSLQGLKKLRTIVLTDTTVGDEGVALLAALPELRSVSVSYPARNGVRIDGTARVVPNDKVQITDKGLLALSAVTRLEELGLAKTQISDDGVNALQNMKDLRVLDLSETKITSKCFGTLQKLTSLETLWLDGVQIDREDIKELAKSLPKCQIKPRP